MSRDAHSTVITSSEREAAYVIDGLMHNDVVQNDIHSTDTHGYSKIIFSVTHLLGISFAPRIKNFKKQNIYAIDKWPDFKTLGYRILPDGKCDMDSVAPYWDDILRFIVTIKLKHATASQLFRRLSSYSQQHTLHKALKQFGRIPPRVFFCSDTLTILSCVKLSRNNLTRLRVYIGWKMQFTLQKSGIPAEHSR